jgi:hypothetical protein
MKCNSLEELFKNAIKGTEAQSLLLHMLEGDCYCRANWKHPIKNDFGFFESPDGEGWFAFDNREYNCVVLFFKTKLEAVEALMHGLECECEPL